MSKGLILSTLVESHRWKLTACGLNADTVMAAGLHSGSEAEVRGVLGYGVGTGLIIPYEADYARVRLDNPGPDGKRYRSPKSLGNRLYVPKTLKVGILRDVSQPLHVTEGEFKALAATQEGFPCVALPGVWSWKSRVHGKSLPIADLDCIAWKGRRTMLVYDSDAAEKPQVAWAEFELCKELRRRGADVFVIRLPEGPSGEKWGFDDYLVANGAEAFRRLPMIAAQEIIEEPVFLRVPDLADAYLLRATLPHNRIHMGYPALDAIMRGLAPGEVLQILGRSGVGKTSFGLNLVEHMTAEEQHPTLIFSLEMQGVEMFERMASMTMGVDGREIEDRARIEDPFIVERFLEVCERWNHIVIVERGCTLTQMDSLIEAARASTFWAEPLRLVVVDYMGLIIPRKLSTPYEHTSEVAKELKRFAKRHRVGLVSLSQIGRDGESGGEPVSLRAARDSGCVEEAADYVLGIWRPELSERLSAEEKAKKKGEFKVRVLKNRSGHAPKTVTLKFEPGTLRIRPDEKKEEAHDV